MVKNPHLIPAALLLMREIRSASLDDVADATGINRATIYRIESGRQDMETVRLGTLSAILDWLDRGHQA